MEKIEKAMERRDAWCGREGSRLEGELHGAIEGYRKSAGVSNQKFLVRKIRVIFPRLMGP